LKIAGFGAKRLVMVQLVCACQGRVALSSLDLHLDSARRAWGLGFYDFAPGTLAKKSECQALAEASVLLTSCNTQEPCLI
jgi:hypothetical protein